MNQRVTYLTLLYVFVLVVAMSAARDKLPISVVSGVYWKEVSQALVYETSVPLLYKTKWPRVDLAHLPLPNVNGFCNDTTNDMSCFVHSWILQADKTVSRHLKWLNSSLNAQVDSSRETSTRRTRSIHFLGDLAHWCCGVITNKQLKPLFTNEKERSMFEKGLSEQVTEAFTEIENVNFNMKNFSDEVERTFAQMIDVGVNITKVIDRFQKQVFTIDRQIDHKSFSLLQISAHHSIRQLQTIQLIARLEILSQCREKKLPSSIVALDKLKIDLINLEQGLHEDEYELVISPGEVSKYLKLEIADCVISGDDILINVKIPIRRKASTWRLYELVAVPFAWKNNTSSLKHDVSFLAEDRGRLVTIQGSTARDCQPYQKPLCHVPRYDADMGSGSSCTRRMFEGASIQELSSVCVFS